MDKPYYFSQTPPNMRPSFVCYADILGYSQLAKEAINAGNGEQFLSHLRKALTSAYDRVKEYAIGLGKQQFFFTKVFTDNIIVGYPIELGLSDGETELGTIFSIFAEFQAGLAMEGFLSRGGIAFGHHYMDNEIIFGDALFEAVEQDKQGGAPNISLAPSVIEVLNLHLGYYAETQIAPQFDYLLNDSDGTIFLNYLEVAFIAYPDDIFIEVFEGHKKTIIEGLIKYKGNPGIRSKYEWVARYHNFICREFAENHPISHDPDADEIIAAAAYEAQKLLDYLIDIEAFTTMPSRINLKSIRPGK